LARLVGPSLPLISFSKVKDFQVQTRFSSKKPWLPKTLPLKLQRRTLDLSFQDPAKTIPKRRVHGMQTRSMAKAATVVVVRQTAEPLPKQQDLQQKVSCWMGKAQAHKTVNSTL